MSNNCSEGLGDDFFEQILAVPENGVGYGRNMDHVGGGVLQLGSTTTTPPLRGVGGIMPLGLNLEQTHHGFLRHQQDATRFVDNVVDVVESNINNNNHHQHLRLHDINNQNNNNNTSSPSSTPGITVCILILFFFLFLRLKYAISSNFFSSDLFFFFF
jgi:hypothetical protein